MLGECPERSGFVFHATREANHLSMGPIRAQLGDLAAQVALLR